MFSFYSGENWGPETLNTLSKVTQLFTHSSRMTPNLVLFLQNDMPLIICSRCFYFALLLLLSHFSHVRLCVTPEMEAHQAPTSLGFSRQEHWSGMPFPSPMHESEK